MPEKVKGQMPASQKQVVDHLDRLVGRVAALQPANDFAREEALKAVGADNEKFFRQFWADRQKQGGLDGWVGRLRIYPGQTSEVHLQFGNAYAWLTHGRKYPRAADRNMAYGTNNDLYSITFGRNRMSETAVAALGGLQDGEWVEVGADLEPDITSARTPGVGLDAVNRVSVGGGSVGGQCTRLKTIRPAGAAGAR